MKLEKKNLVYSIAIAGILLLFLIGYFGGMLPSLYVAYVEDQHLNSAIHQQEYYIKEHSYDNEEQAYSSLCFTMELPPQSSRILITSQLAQLSVEITDPRLRSILDDIRTETAALSLSKLQKDSAAKEHFKGKLTEWESTLKSVWETYKKEHIDSYSPIQIHILDSVFQKEDEDNSDNASFELHLVSDSMIVYESKVRYSQNYYSNYFAASLDSGSLIVTYLPAVTPRMDEITPIVLQSMPMLIAVTILIVLLFSVFYSRKIVHPITELEMYTRNANYHHTLPVPKVCENSKDEIASLGKALNELYTKLHSQYEELEHKNKLLEEENQRQEVFLKASSHQLKTPVAAALLLVDGMIAKVGKYKDTDTYLPEIKTQLLQMKKMIDDILYLRHCETNLALESITLDWLVPQCIQNHHMLLVEHGHEVEYIQTDLQPVIVDVDLTCKILDNLLLNAAVYATEQTKLIVHADGRRILIFNQGQIADELLPHIYEPFVSGQKDNRGHGLGLYIVSYYAKVLSASVTIENINSPVHGSGVLATLCLPSAHALIHHEEE